MKSSVIFLMTNIIEIDNTFSVKKIVFIMHVVQVFSIFLSDVFLLPPVF